MKKSHKSYAVREGTGKGSNNWRVYHWDDDYHMYVAGDSLHSYGMARIIVGSANCPHKNDGKCQIESHRHGRGRRK